MKKTVKLFAIIAIALSAISCSSIQNLFVKKKQVLQKKKHIICQRSNTFV